MKQSPCQLEMSIPHLEISDLSYDDVPEVAQLHFQLFGKGSMHGYSMARLGQEFLEDVFYRVNLDNPYFFCNVARYEGRLIGFSVFSTDHRRVFRYSARKHFVRVMLSVFLLSVRRPSVVVGLLRNIRYAIGVDESWTKGITGWWIVAGVRPECRKRVFRERSGIHVAAELFDCMEAVMCDQGCLSWYGVVHPQNTAINTFLEQRRAQAVGIAPAQGMDMRYYIKRLGSDGSSSPS